MTGTSAAKIELAPGAKARAAVPWRARGYDQTKPSTATVPLAPGRYRLDLTVPTLAKEQKTAATATAIVAPP